MHKLNRRTVATPKGAVYAKAVRIGSNTSVKVSYFTEGKVPLHHSRISPAASYMHDHEFETLIETKIEVGKDPDLKHGRELRADEKEAIENDEYDNGDKEIHDKSQKVGVGSKTPDLKGKGPGTPVGETKPGDPGKKLAESHDNATYSWKSIHRALAEQQMTTDEIRAIAMSLSGSEITEDIGDDKAAADTEVAMSTSDPARKTKPQEIFTGQPLRNVYNAIESISKGDTNDVANLPKGTKINIIRHGVEAVSKIIPGKVINTINQDGKVIAEIQVADQTTKIVIARAGSVFLKRGRQTGMYYYLSPIEA